MAPKSAPLTAETIDFNKPKPLGGKPITTQEKLQAAAAKRAAAEKHRTLSPPPDTSTAIPKKKSKIKNIPPPGEAFQEPSKPKGRKTGLDSKIRKPMTTQEKIRAAEIGKKEGCKRWRKEKGGAKKVKEYRPSALSVLAMGAAPTAIKFEDWKGKGVLTRPTERAKAERRTIDMRAEIAANRTSNGNSTLKIGKVVKQKQNEVPFRLMDLPEEVRTRIWKLAVVHHPFCVWPGQAKGREQPDLGMSGREVRAEVLPVFYGANFFGVDITPVEQPKAIVETKAEPKGMDGEKKHYGDAISQAETKGKVGLTEQRHTSSIPKPEMQHKALAKSTFKPLPDLLEEIQPWALALEPSAHLSRIQHWIFSSTLELPTPSGVPRIDTANSLIVYLHPWREDESWKAKVEVHREACCVLPGQSEFGRCVVRNSPDWLNAIVQLVLKKAESRGITAEMVMGLGKVLRSRVGELTEAICVAVGKLSENEQEVGGV